MENNTKKKLSKKQLRKRKELIKKIAFVFLFIVISIVFLKVNFSIRIINVENQTVQCGESLPKEPLIMLVGKYIMQDSFILDNKYLYQSGTIDYEQIGEYTLQYKAKYGIWSNEITQTVMVVDKEKPTILLSGEQNVSISYTQEYVEDGYKAIDNYDGDITNKVLIEKTKDKITYSVVDSSSNESIVERNIAYIDDVYPELTINGNEYYEMFVGEEYVEMGYTAIDEYDGDITSKVVVDNMVDNQVAGEYMVLYTIEDAAHNKVSKMRIVNVKEKPIEQASKTIYLTFDDGPCPYTEKLLDILDKYDVKATFFVVDSEDYNYLIKEEYKRGHTVAIHSKSHDYSEIYKSESAFYNDLYAMQKIIYELIGENPMLIRFPGGSSNEVSRKYNKGIMTRLSKSVQSNGYQYFDWNVSSGDATGKKLSPMDVYNNVISGISENENSIVLQHDIKEFSVDAVESIIIWGLENGYQFSALTIDSPTCHHKISN